MMDLDPIVYHFKYLASPFMIFVLQEQVRSKLCAFEASQQYQSRKDRQNTRCTLLENYVSSFVDVFYISSILFCKSRACLVPHLSQKFLGFGPPFCRMELNTIQNFAKWLPFCILDFGLERSKNPERAFTIPT